MTMSNEQNNGGPSDDDDPEYKEVLIGITDAKVARYSAAYMRAVDAAKSARFEFGQKGAL